jgi:hypothetical protein
MNKVFLITFIVCLLLVSDSFSQNVKTAAKPSKESAEIFETLKRWSEGMGRGDSQVLSQMYSDQLVITASDDSLRGKPEELKYLKLNDPSILSSVLTTSM